MCGVQCGTAQQSVQNTSRLCLREDCFLFLFLFLFLVLGM